MSGIETKNDGQVIGKDDGATSSFNVSGAEPIGQIGSYKLLSILGEGGFSIVYLAEQDKPVRRRVALKVIKPGMDTKQVIARFKAERQTLAMLEHPNIAPVFDAGTTEGGLPYFVMENVKGVPIIEHCDRNKLTIDERLHLFLQACEGIEYAHQKGIIHRDVKPSNILVSVQGEKAVLKIIDFGVAKAIAQPLTDRTLYTEQGQFIGTPEYMSPEQMEMGAQDIDTRSDVYSLGVLLYELLIGAMPFDSQMLRKGGVENIRKVVLEQEPKKPSTRLTSLGDEAPRIAEERSTDVANLTRRLRRELEWIPLKAMRKDRTRRYRSASELGDDISNYLNGIPLIAGPESTVYRLKKLVRRNLALVSGVLVVLAVMVAGSIISTTFAVKASRARADAVAARDEAERQAKTSQAVSDFLRDDLLASVDPYVTQGREVTVRSFLDVASAELEGKFKQEPLVEASIRHTLGNTYRNIGDFGPAEKHLERAYNIQRDQLGQEHPETLGTMEGLARVYWRQGRYDKAQQIFNKTVEGRRKVLGDEHPETLYSMNDLAMLYYSQGRYAEAESLYTTMLQISRAILGDEIRTVLFMGNLATVYRSQGRYSEAEPLYVRAMEQSQRLLGEEHPDTLYCMNGLAMLWIDQSRYEEAEALLLKVLDIEYLVLGEEHLDTLYSLNGLAALYTAQRRYEEAEKLLLNVVNIGQLTLGEEHPTTLTSVNCLGRLYYKMSRYSDSELLLVNALQSRQFVLGNEHPDTLESKNDLAVLYRKQARYEEAETLLLAAVEGRRLKLGETHPNTLESWKNLIELYEDWGKAEKSEEWRAKLPGKAVTQEQ
ncbi:MAG: serine/threonine-protein kinase [Sedimentisphaerales bacterium]|nr:serine/threonine-protein kinase [Sedimentisphaerales bacterium]